MFDVSRGGNLSTDSSVRRQKRFQSALRKFQRFTKLLWAVTLSFVCVMREGRCCDLGNFPRTHLSGSRLSWSKLAKARSGLVTTKDVNRVPRGAVLENFAAYQPRRVTFICIKLRQRCKPRGRSSNDESLRNEKTFLKLLS